VADFERNLIIVHTPKLQERSDFEAIAEMIADRAPDIEVFIVENGTRQSLTRKRAASRPTLVFSPIRLREFSPLRGKVHTGRYHPKTEEIARLVAAGINVPEAVPVEPETRLDPATWGPFTVVKPLSGMAGYGIRLVRTRDVRWVDPQSWPDDDPRHGQEMYAQRFVDTGVTANCYRVMVVYGRPVYCSRSTLLTPRPPLDPDGDDPLDLPIAANADGWRRIEHAYDSDVIAAAAGAQRAFPEIPVLGVDLVRDVRSGAIYLLEVNPSGFTWHISSDYSKKVRREHNLDYMGQFGALDIIADALIDATRREAE
jgi:hypothetical protein